jgi:hypothetical protein
LTSRQGRIGQAPGAPKAGNNSRRLRLRVDVPGYGPADAGRLATDIASVLTQTAAEGGDGAVRVIPAQQRPADDGAVRINGWWRDDPAECYWMEITNRDDLGANVRALQREGVAVRTGRTPW